jgi:hypothetical protein
MSFKINSAMAGEVTPDVSNVKGKSFKLTFSPHGKELDFAGAENIKINFGFGEGEQSIKNNFRDILTNLPQNPIKMGDTWTIKEEETIPQNNMEIKTIIEATNNLIGYETVNGYECLKIQTKSKGTVEGSGVQMGSEFDMEGDLEGESTWYFAYKKGVLVKSTTDLFLESTISVTSPQAMTIPMTQETKVEIKLLSPPPK